VFIMATQATRKTAVQTAPATDTGKAALALVPQTTEAAEAGKAHTAERAELIQSLREAFNADAKADKARAELADLKGKAESPLKAAATYFKATYTTLDAMLTPEAEADIKAAIADALPDDLKLGHQKKQAGLIMTPTKLLAKGISKATQVEHMAWAKAAADYSRYLSTYTTRIREYAFPVADTPETRARKSIEAAFKAHCKLGKVGIPKNVTVEQFSAAKKALREVGLLYGLDLADTAKA
jgi:hypothetical protein